MPSRLGGLEVHGHLEFGRQLHREIVRLRAAQNAIERVEEEPSLLGAASHVMAIATRPDA